MAGKITKRTSPIKVLVITSCAGEKKYNPPNPAHAKDLDNLQLRQLKGKELEDYRAKAREMFISSQNQMIMEGFSYLPSSPEITADIGFISAGYGYLNADDYVVPYDVNFSAMSMIDLDKRSDLLKAHEETYYAARNYDIVLFLLGYEYLRVLKLPLQLPETTKQFYFISTSDEKVLPTADNIFVIKTGNEESAKFEITPSELKGHIFKLLCQQYKNSKENIFAKIYENPSYIEELIQQQLDGINNKFDQLQLFDF